MCWSNWLCVSFLLTSKNCWDWAPKNRHGWTQGYSCSLPPGPVACYWELSALLCVGSSWQRCPGLGVPLPGWTGWQGMGRLPSELVFLGFVSQSLWSQPRSIRSHSEATFPFPPACLQVSSRGWQPSAWEGSSSWGPMRRHASCCSELGLVEEPAKLPTPRRNLPMSAAFFLLPPLGCARSSCRAAWTPRSLLTKSKSSNNPISQTWNFSCMENEWSHCESRAKKKWCLGGK